MKIKKPFTQLESWSTTNNRDLTHKEEHSFKPSHTKKTRT